MIETSRLRRNRDPTLLANPGTQPPDPPLTGKTKGGTTMSMLELVP